MPSLLGPKPVHAILEDKVPLAQIFEDYPNVKRSHIAIKEPSQVGAEKDEGLQLYVANTLLKVAMKPGGRGRGLARGGDLVRREDLARMACALSMASNVGDALARCSSSCLPILSMSANLLESTLASPPCLPGGF
jgi:hypothetical protein